MRLSTRKNLLQALAIGMVHMNNPVTFAGVRNNFAYTPGGGNNGAPGNQPPINPGAVPPHQVSGPNGSKVNPGQPSSTPGDPNHPNAPANPGNPQVQDGSSPLDIYANLFDNSPQLDKDGKPIQAPANILDSGVDNFAKMAEKLQFQNVATPEQMELMAKGGQEGIAAMMEVMQNFGRQVFAHAAATSTAVTKKGLDGKSKELQTNINNAIRLHGLSENLLKKDPRLSNPAVAPLVAVVQQQMATKFPNDTVAQLEQKVSQYFKEGFSAFTQEPAAAQTKDEEVPFNFLDFLKK